MFDKKTVISHVVALLLGALGGFLGKDLSGFQKPAETAATVVVDKAAVVVEHKIEGAKPPATKAADAGPVLSAPPQ